MGWADACYFELSGLGDASNVSSRFGGCPNFSVKENQVARICIMVLDLTFSADLGKCFVYKEVKIQNQSISLSNACVLIETIHARILQTYLFDEKKGEKALVTQLITCLLPICSHCCHCELSPPFIS